MFWQSLHKHHVNFQFEFQIRNGFGSDKIFDTLFSIPIQIHFNVWNNIYDSGNFYWTLHWNSLFMHRKEEKLVLYNWEHNIIFILKCTSEGVVQTLYLTHNEIEFIIEDRVFFHNLHYKLFLKFFYVLSKSNNL